MERATTIVCISASAVRLLNESVTRAVIATTRQMPGAASGVGDRLELLVHLAETVERVLPAKAGACADMLGVAFDRSVGAPDHSTRVLVALGRDFRDFVVPRDSAVMVCRNMCTDVESGYGERVGLSAKVWTALLVCVEGRLPLSHCERVLRTLL